jgi:hypothetical protein
LANLGNGLGAIFVFEDQPASYVVSKYSLSHYFMIFLFS